MKTITIEVIEGEGGRAFLLLESQIQQRRMEADQAKATAAALGFDEEKPQKASPAALLAWIEGEGAAAEVEGERLRRQQYAKQIRKVVFQIEDPDVSHQIEIARRLRVEGDGKPLTPELENLIRSQTAVELLNPRQIDGEPLERDPSLNTLLAFECCRLLYPNLSEERQLFFPNKPPVLNSGKGSRTRHS